MAMSLAYTLSRWLCRNCINNRRFMNTAHRRKICGCNQNIDLNFINNQRCDCTASYTWNNFNDVDWNAVNNCLAVVDWSCVLAHAYVRMILILHFMMLFMTIYTNIPQSASHGSRRNKKRIYPPFVGHLESKKLSTRST